MSSVRYIPAISTDAGAIPVGTEVADHPRAGDGFKVQDVYIDPQSFPLEMTRADASVGTDSLCNRDVTATAVTGGRVVFADYAAPAAAGVKSSGKTGILDKIPLSVSALGVGDIISICCIRNGTANSATQAALNWTEVR